MGSRLIALALVAVLAACGVDGPPQRPAAEPGLTVSGTVEMGVSGGN
ncbi:lipoprotein [Rhodovulum imhoffii]|nr:lipoprotein [Rhodovulum imhoffii]MBK5934820.1 argininosuccinate lyase [Rhodovulum imhoffii]